MAFIRKFGEAFQQAFRKSFGEKLIPEEDPNNSFPYNFDIKIWE